MLNQRALNRALLARQMLLCRAEISAFEAIEKLVAAKLRTQATTHVPARRSSCLEPETLAAYVERANVYYNAGQPRLYKFALGDFRRALRYDPENADAKEKMEMLVSIYKSMGRPIPNNGNEP